MKIAFLADDLLIPTNSGGRRELVGEISGLREAGHDVTVVIFHRDETNEAEMAATRKRFDNVMFVPRAGFIAATLTRPWLPFQVSSRHARVELIADFVSQPDVVIASHEWCLPFARKLADRTNSWLLMRSHNNEVQYMESLAKHASGFQRVYFHAERIRLAMNLRRILRGADAIGVIAPEDAAVYERHSRRVFSLPPVMAGEVQRELFSPPSNPTIGYLGALDSSHTAHGILWFISEVLPLVRKRIPEASLIVAGRRASEATVSAMTQADGVTYLGEIDSPLTVYEKSRVFINPVFGGSGVNIKLGAPAEYGLPVISTSFGVRGLSTLAEAAVLADDAASFADAVCRLLRDDHHWRAASEALSKSVSTLSGTAFAERVSMAYDARFEAGN